MIRRWRAIPSRYDSSTFCRTSRPVVPMLAVAASALSSAALTFARVWPKSVMRHAAPADRPVLYVAEKKPPHEPAVGFSGSHGSRNVFDPAPTDPDSVT